MDDDKSMFAGKRKNKTNDADSHLAADVLYQTNKQSREDSGLVEDGRSTPAGTQLREKETAPATASRPVESEYGSVNGSVNEAVSRTK